jgi:hypothetical protein
MGGVMVTWPAGRAAGTAAWAGVLLCLLAAATSACGQVCQIPALRHASALQGTAFGCLAGTAVMMPFVGQLARQLAAAPPAATLSVLYLGLLPRAGIHYLGIRAARSTAGRMAAATYTIPAIVVLLSWLLLRQTALTASRTAAAPAERSPDRTHVVEDQYELRYRQDHGRRVSPIRPPGHPDDNEDGRVNHHCAPGPQGESDTLRLPVPVPAQPAADRHLCTGRQRNRRVHRYPQHHHQQDAANCHGSDAHDVLASPRHTFTQQSTSILTIRPGGRRDSREFNRPNGKSSEGCDTTAEQGRRPTAIRFT